MLVPQASGLAIAFAVQAILARLLGASGLGLYTLSLTVAGIAGIGANLGLSQALIHHVARNSDNPQAVSQYVVLGLSLSAGLGIVGAAVLFGMRGLIAQFFDCQQLTGLLILVAVSLPFASVFASVQGVLNGLRSMRTYALTGVSRRLLRAAVVLPVVVAGFGVVGAVAGVLAAEVCACLVGVWFARRYLAPLTGHILVQTKELASFGALMCAANAVYAVFAQVDILFIGRLMSASAVGTYSVAVTIASFFSIVPGAIQMVMFPTASHSFAANDFESVTHLLHRVIRWTTCIMLPLGLGVFFFGDELIRLVFGPAYVIAFGPLLILVSIRIIRGSTMTPVAKLIPALGRPDINLKIDIGGLLLNGCLNAILIPRLGLIGAAVGTAIALLANTAVFFWWLRRFSPITIDLRWHLRASLTACLAVGVFLGLSLVLGRSASGACVLAAYLLVVWGVLLEGTDRALAKDIVRLVISRRGY